MKFKQFIGSISKPEWALLFIWALVQGWVLYQYGIITGLEARKYIEQADLIQQTGTVSTPNFWLYSTQIFLITGVKQLHLGYGTVVLIQWIMNALATRALYRLIQSKSNPATALIITLIFILNFPLQNFNISLQTESLFFSLTILFTCYLFSLEKLTLRNALYLFLLLVLICFTRPTGLLWVPGTALYLFYRFFRGIPFLLKTGITVGVTGAFLYFLNKALGSGGELDFMLPFRDERIICGVPTLPHYLDIKVSDNPNSLEGLWYYITHNTEQFIRLAWIRTEAFFGLSRSYYSKSHNLYLMLNFYPVTLLAVTGIWFWFRKKGVILVYCLSVIFLTWLTVILTCDDWHNRFFLSIVPYIYILAIPVIHKFTEYISNARKPAVNQRGTL